MKGKQPDGMKLQWEHACRDAGSDTGWNKAALELARQDAQQRASGDTGRLKRQRDELLVALERYGQHEKSCKAWAGINRTVFLGPGFCSCGLSALIERVRREP